MIAQIAWRNLWRNKTRSLTILAAVTLGLWSGIFVLGFYNGMIEQRVSSAIRKEISHIQMHHPSFSEDFDIRRIIPQGDMLLQHLQNNPAVEAASGRMIVKGMIASANGSAGITINGVLPVSEHKLTRLRDKLVAGSYLTKGKPDQILLSRKLCKKLKLDLKRKLVLTFQDSSGNLASAAFRVAGIFETSNTPYDEFNAFVDARTLGELAAMPGAINELAVLLNPRINLLSMQDSLQIQHPDLKVENWMQISPEIGLTASVSDLIVYIFMGIILMALAFGIINTMLMAILERTREIGMLMALGMNHAKIFRMILFETCFLILAACPFGLFLGLGSVWMSNHYGIDLGSFSDLYKQYGYESMVFPTLSMRQIVQILILVLVTALVSSVFPARRALKLRPAESVKRAN